MNLLKIDIKTFYSWIKNLDKHRQSKICHESKIYEISFTKPERNNTQIVQARFSFFFFNFRPPFFRNIPLFRCEISLVNMNYVLQFCRYTSRNDFRRVPRQIPKPTSTRGTDFPVCLRRKLLPSRAGSKKLKTP